MTVDLELIEETLPFVAVAVAYLQGQVQSQYVGDDVINALDEMGALEGDLPDKLDALFSYLNETIGTENMVSAILTLFGCNIFTTDGSKVQEYFEPVHDQADTEVH